MKDIKILLKKKKTENDNMVVNDRKVSQKLKSNYLMSIEKMKMKI